MNRHIIEIPSADRYVYRYDADDRTLWKICGGDIPTDVLETLHTLGIKKIRTALDGRRTCPAG